MPFVPDNSAADTSKKPGFVPDTPAAPDDHFRLGPVASSIVRPLAKGLAEPLMSFDPEPKSLPGPGGTRIQNPRFTDEFEQFLDRYTTKPERTLGKTAELAGSVLAGGLLPMGTAAKAETVVEGGVTKAAGAVAGMTVKGAAQREASRWGFKVAPEDMENPNLIGRISSYIGGRSIGRGISRHNADRFDELGRNSLNLPEGTHLDAETFRGIRENAGRAYEALRNGPPVEGADMLTDLVKLGSNIEILEAEMPGVVSSEIKNELASIKGALLHDQIKAGTLMDAIKFWRADAGKHFASNEPRNWYRAVFERQAADIAEDALEKAATKAGNPQLVSDVQNARRVIARSYALEDATNTSTGHVNAEILKRLSKDRPLDGELKAIADFAKAHPHSAQSIDRIGTLEAQSKLRFFLAAGAFLAGHPGYAGALSAEAAATAVGGSRLTQGVGRAAAGTGQRRANLPGMALSGAAQTEPQMGQ